MRPVFLALLGLGLLVSTGALGRLVQPDGTVMVLGESSDGGSRTLLFAPQAVPASSWLSFPAGTVLDDAVAITARGRTTLDFPTVPFPGARYALEVPARILALTLRGRVPEGPVVYRTVGRPDVPGRAWVARSARSASVDLPPWTTAGGFTPLVSVVRRGEGPWTATVSSGSVSRTFALDPALRAWDFAPRAWGFTPERLEVGGSGIASLQVRAVPASADLPADPPTLLAWPTAGWRSPTHEWFAWTGTSVLVLVTRDYRVQDAYLKRLAFFVEKKGFRGRLWSDDDLALLHGWNAHDYAAPDLARFYTTAAAQAFPLHPEEVELRDRLTAAGVLVPRGKGVWEGGTGALVGISAESPPALRAALFTHEAFHGLYYTSPDFRSGVAAAWQGLSGAAQEAFRSYLAVSDYDPGFEALMVNEFQAYVLQRPSAEWAFFFRDRVLGGARALAKSRPSPAVLGEFLGAARTLDALVGRLYGLRSGDVSLVELR
jgi:hypothetical protein